jgi:hypothetical protein
MKAISDIHTLDLIDLAKSLRSSHLSSFQWLISYDNNMHITNDVYIGRGKEGVMSTIRDGVK